MDEHVPPEVEGFRDEGFRVVEVRLHRAFAGRDEADYLKDLRKDRGVFVTSDREHVERLRRQAVGHHGVIFLPPDWDRKGKAALAVELASIVKTAISELGSMGFDNVVLDADEDGIHYREGGRERRLLASWPRYLGGHLDV